MLRSLWSWQRLADRTAGRPSDIKTSPQRVREPTQLECDQHWHQLGEGTIVVFQINVEGLNYHCSIVLTCIIICSICLSLFYLYVGLVVVVWTCELGFLANSLSKEHDLKYFCSESQYQRKNFRPYINCEDERHKRTCSKRKTVISLILKLGPLVGSSVQKRGPRNNSLP